MPSVMNYSVAFWLLEVLQPNQYTTVSPYITMSPKKHDFRYKHDNFLVTEFLFAEQLIVVTNNFRAVAITQLQGQFE